MYIYRISLNYSYNEKCFKRNLQRKFEKGILCLTNFSPEHRTVLLWTNMVEQDRPQVKIWRMRIACWITKATNTHSEYVVLIAFLLRQWLHERTSMLRQTYVPLPVLVSLVQPNRT
jgi:hypothetical protein